MERRSPLLVPVSTAANYFPTGLTRTNSYTEPQWSESYGVFCPAGGADGCFIIGCIIGQFCIICCIL